MPSGCCSSSPFVTSIPALALFQPVLDDPVGYVANGDADNQIFLGALLELLLIAANIATALVVYPVLKRQNHGIYCVVWGFKASPILAEERPASV